MGDKCANYLNKGNHKDDLSYIKECFENLSMRCSVENIKEEARNNRENTILEYHPQFWKMEVCVKIL